jgi:hypothetical protein
MRFFYHDNTPAKPGEPHGERGPTHCGSQNVTLDYEYQLEMHLDDIAKSYPHIVRIESNTGREWKRDANGNFVEVAEPEQNANDESNLG